jgi:hypothetical protein
MPYAARIVYSRDGHAIEITDAPLRHQSAEWFSAVVFPAATFHLTCCRTPEWAYHVGFGRVQDDGLPLPPPRRWSLGCTLHAIGHWCERLGHYNDKRLAEIPVSDEFVLEHFPDSFVDLGDDGKPEDL